MNQHKHFHILFLTTMLLIINLPSTGHGASDNIDGIKSMPQAFDSTNMINDIDDSRVVLDDHIYTFSPEFKGFSQTGPLDITGFSKGDEVGVTFASEYIIHSMWLLNRKQAPAKEAPQKKSHRQKTKLRFENGVWKN